MKLLRQALVLLVLAPLAFATSYTVGASGKSFTTFAACAAVAVGDDFCSGDDNGSYAGWTQPTSGTSGHVITFNAINGHTPTITSTVTISGRSYITFGGAASQGLTFTAATNAINADSASTHNTVDHNSFTGTRIWFCADGAGSGCSNNVISNNTITRSATVTTASAIYIYGDSTRIEGNTTTGGTSDFLNIGGNFAVIRNNTFSGPDGTTSGEHIDFLQVVGGGTIPTLAFALIEGNVFKNCTNQCHLFIVRTGSGPVADTIIARRNYVYNIALGSGAAGCVYGGGGDNVPHGWCYNNTIATLNTAAENGDCVSWQNAANGVSLNNICYQTQANSWSPTIGNAVGNADIAFNSGYASTWNAPYSAEATYATLRNVNPLFANYPTDGTLQASSPARSAGVPLTTASGAGAASTLLTVADAHGLQPGWAGTQADWIRIGSLTTRQISSINYSTNVITLASPATWSNGDAIHLYKDSSGTVVLTSASPDIGAFPYIGSATAYFVKNGGSDAAAGTSDALAWATIAKVNAKLFNPGDSVSFKRGSTWNEATDAALIASSSGTLGSPITYTAYGSGALPILDGQGTVAQGFTTSSKAYIVVDSLNIKRNTTYGALFASCNTCSLTNSTITDSGTHSVNVTAVSPLFIATGNTINTSAAFSMLGKAFNIASTSAALSTISSNVIDLTQVLSTRNVSGIVCSASTIGCAANDNTITMAQGLQGIGIKSVSATGHTVGGQIIGNSITGLNNNCTGCDGEALELTGDATHQVTGTLISGNFIKMGTPASDCMGLFNATGSIVSYNWCIAGAGVNAGVHPSTGANSNFFYGNSLYLPGTTYGFEATSGTGNDYQNNIVVGSNYGFIFSAGGTGTFSSNIAFSNPTANFSGGTNNGNNLTSDPKWASATPTVVTDFRLLGTSPAIASGANLGSTYQSSNNPVGSFPFNTGLQSTSPGWTRGAFLFNYPVPSRR